MKTVKAICKSLASALFCALFCALLYTAPTQAGVDDGFQMWTPVYLDAPIVRKKYRGYFEVNPRMQDGMGGLQQLIVRPALGVRVNQHVSAFAGYAWITNYNRNNFLLQEQRLWQQVGYGFRPFPKMILLNRLRLEERFIQHTDSQTAWRLRYMLRGEVPLLKTKNYVVAFDELFINMNTVANGVQSGIDQNRLYVGLGRRIHRNLRGEIAYQQQYVNRQDVADDKASHILMTSVFLDF